MAALNKIKPNLGTPRDTVSKAAARPETVRAVEDGQVIEPVASPAHELQEALHRAYGARPMSNTMLVLSVICVYTMSMLMFFGSVTA